MFLSEKVSEKFLSDQKQKNSNFIKTKNIFNPFLKHKKI